jgi:hypothetical protein
MKTILATLLAMSVVGGLAGLAVAADSGMRGPRVATTEYDFPDFGSQPWWQLHDDQG